MNALFRGRKKYVVSIVIFLVLVLYQRFYPSPDVLSEQNSGVTPTPAVKEQSIKEEAKVTRVIDGDTIEVLLDNKEQKVRVIGINTPETVDPRRPVQCFGKEASEFAKARLSGQTIYLESDPSQANQDNYGRLLRYVWVDNGLIDFGKHMIVQGFAHEYTYDLPYKYQKDYKDAEQQAREGKLGLWKNTACSQGSS